MRSCRDDSELMVIKLHMSLSKSYVQLLLKAVQFPRPFPTM